MGWLVRVLKGILIGTGFILPGVSGGVLAAILGVYERLIRFFADIRKDFWKNMKYFFPMGIGGIVSIVVCSALLSTFFEIAEVQLIWLFIGCVAGTLPTLLSQAGKNGRKSFHIAIMGGTAVVAFLLLFYMKDILGSIQIPLNNFFVWIFAGALMGLGGIVPGLSPSNFLIYLNMYKPMTDHFKNINVMVIIAVLIGAIACFLLLSKVMEYLFDHMYAGLYHVIIGVIIASTISIIPRIHNGIYVNEDGVRIAVTNGGLVLCLVTFAAGYLLGFFMGILEKKYKED